MARTLLRRLGLSLGVLAFLLSPATGMATEPKVLVVARPSIGDPSLITTELGVMVDMLKKAGFTPVVASSSLVTFDNGKTKVKADVRFADVVASDYVGIVMPCLANPEGGTTAPEVVKIATDAAAAGEPIAAQRSSLYILSKAGLLKGRKYAYVHAAWFPEGVYGGDGVVQDGNIITSAICPNAAQDFAKPDGTVPLMNAFIKVLKG
jgi:putative intracellular protease/amidase